MEGEDLVCWIGYRVSRWFVWVVCCTCTVLRLWHIRAVFHEGVVSCGVGGDFSWNSSCFMGVGGGAGF